MESLKELYKIGCGPSSSHTMGPSSAAKEFISRHPDAYHFKVVLYASLALTGKGHLTDQAIKKVLGEDTIIEFDFKSEVQHPNTMDFFAFKEDELLEKVRYISVGGGSIKIDGQKTIKPKKVYSFKDFTDIMNYCTINNKKLVDVVTLAEPEVFIYLKEVWQVMQDSITRGIKKEGVLPGKLGVHRKAHKLFENSSNNERNLICSYAYAVAEENASGGVVVTSPTCGSSGVLPAILYYLKIKKQISDEKIYEALAVAGIVGNIIKKNASISGAEAGCQAEIGSACAMASAAAAYLLGMNHRQMEVAAEIGLEHNLGLTCDPVKGYVQIPCIERNAMAALRALDATNLAYYIEDTSKVSLDVVIKTMYATGIDINARYRETSQGGLAKHFKK